MTKPIRKSAEEARNQLPDLLEAAQKGRSTIINRGRVEAFGAKIVAERFAIFVTNGTDRVMHDRDFSRVKPLRVIT
jgi:hypothetical protein